MEVQQEEFSIEETLKFEIKEETLSDHTNVIKAEIKEELPEDLELWNSQQDNYVNSDLVKIKQEINDVDLKSKLLHDEYDVSVKKVTNSVYLKGELLHDEYDIPVKSETDDFTEPVASKQCKVVRKRIRKRGIRKKKFSYLRSGKAFRTISKNDKRLGGFIHNRIVTCNFCGNIYTTRYTFFYDCLCSHVNRRSVKLHNVLKLVKDESDIVDNRVEDISIKLEETCQNIIKLPSDSTSHLLRFHDGRTPFKCEICRKNNVPSKSNLNDHMRLHAGKKPFKCEICSKQFILVSTLNLHKRIHTEEKPFKCEICPQLKFKYASTFNRHIFIHTGESPYECAVCRRGFTCKGNLKVHMRRHTGEKPFTCEICSKQFTYMPDLNTHKFIHTCEKPFKCEICSKQFKRVSSLNRHKRVHSSEKQFKCEICLQQFKYMSNLNRHGLIHTVETPYISVKFAENILVLKAV